MSWFGKQIQSRFKKDRDSVSDALLQVVDSIGDEEKFHARESQTDNVRTEVARICHHFALEIPEEVPATDKINDLIDYLVGNTDRHWGNWGFLVSNDTNRLEKLYPLMDFNKSFLAYDTIDGARCQTSSRKLSQREAAIEAVHAVGLNQIAEVRPAWFEDPAVRDMFFRRLETVKKAVG